METVPPNAVTKIPLLKYSVWLRTLPARKVNRTM